MPRGRAKITSDRKRTAKEVAQMIQLDKNGNVLRDKEVIGRISFDGGVFIGENFLSQKKVRRFDFDEVAAWLGLKA